MTVASGANERITYIVESTYGTTPSTPTMQEIDTVNFNVGLDSPTLQDPTRKANRQRSYARRGNKSTTGTMEVVLCPNNYDSFIEAAMMGTWTADVVKIGTTKRSFSFERGNTDIAQYRTSAGTTIANMAITVPVDGLVTASFGLEGSTESVLSGTSIDADPTAVTEEIKFYHEDGTFKEGGSSIAYIQSITFTLENAVTKNFALGANGVRDITPGNAAITGNATFLFENATQYNKFVNATESSIEFTLTDGTSTLTFDMPRVIYTTASIPSNTTGPIIIDMAFEALYSDTDGSALVITRA